MLWGARAGARTRWLASTSRARPHHFRALPFLARLHLDLPRLEGAEEGGDHLGVETGAGELGDGLDRVLRAVGLLIRAVGGNGIEGVGHRDDAGDERDLLSLQAVGVTTSIPGLV